MSGVQLRDVSKAYPGVKALDAVDFDVRPGEVHVLLGENGAGKSTLIKMLAGVHTPDRGEIKIDGETVHITGPDRAEQLGITTIHQEMALVPRMTVAENVFLGRPPRRFGLVDHHRMYREAHALVERTGLYLDVSTPIETLGVAQRQRVEIAKALAVDARVLVMDEPTAVLSRNEVTTLFELVRELTERGVGVVFISHLLHEVAEIGDRVTVLRDGRKVGECPADESTDELVRLMVGRSVDQQFPQRDTDPGEVVLDVRELGRDGAFEDVSLTARAGEVVGIGGLVGAGRTELVRAIFGADRVDHGSVLIDGTPLPRGDVAAARSAGLALVPEDRAAQGLVLGASVQDNLGLVMLSEHSRAGLVDRDSQRRAAEESVRGLGIRARDVHQPVGTLSGGNQQKIVIGKWLQADPRVLVLDEPTRGIDVGARAEIYELITDLTGRGTAVVVVSSDLTELLGLSDRVLVMADGRLRGELARAEATQQRVMELAVSN